MVIPRTVNWQAMQDSLVWLNRVAMADLLPMYKAAATFEDPNAASMWMQHAFEDVARSYGAAAGDLTADWWNDLAGDEKLYLPGGADINPEQLSSSVRWATAPIVTGYADPLVRMAAVMQKIIYSASRDKVQVGVSKAGVRYARVARSDACPFCQVLATRGFDYATYESAKYVGQNKTDVTRLNRRNKTREKRFQRAPGDQYHDNCRCIIVPDNLPGTKLEVPAHYEKFKENYAHALKHLDDGETPTIQTITKKIRQLAPTSHSH